MTGMGDERTCMRKDAMCSYRVVRGECRGRMLQLVILCGTHSFALLVALPLCLSLHGPGDSMRFGSRLDLASHCMMCMFGSVRSLWMWGGLQHGTGAVHRWGRDVSLHARSRVGHPQRGMGALARLCAYGRQLTFQMQPRDGAMGCIAHTIDGSVGPQPHFAWNHGVAVYFVSV